MRLDDALKVVALEYGHKTALDICDGPSITFTELWSRVETVSAGLVSRGISPGDRVAVMSRHDIDAFVLFWAILRARGIVVWLNDDSRAADLSFVLENASPGLIFAQTNRHVELLAEITGASPKILQLSEAGRLLSGKAQQLQPDGGEEDVATIVYTSGSSGRPKGVCLTHRNLWTVASSVIRHMPIEKNDSYLMVVPLHYIHGVMQFLVHALVGATVYFHDSFVFPRKVVSVLQTTEVTGFSGVPFHFNALISRGGLFKAELPKLRWMTVTGGKLATKTILEILDNFPGVNFHIAYGQTECAPRATALDPARTRAKPDSVGSPIPDVSVLLLGETGDTVPEGEVGEVVVSGENVMQGYWLDEAATKEVIDERGRLHTGDLGRCDADGDLYLVGRKSAMIKSAGERIVPEEIERVLVAHAQVEDAVVVGVADDLYGQRVVAHILTTTDCAQNNESGLIAAIREHCLKSMSLARAPREYHLWPEFPRKANGKPDRMKIAKSERSIE